MSELAILLGTVGLYVGGLIVLTLLAEGYSKRRDARRRNHVSRRRWR